MNEERLKTIEQIEAFLEGSAAVEFSVAGDDIERYGQISRVLKRFDYRPSAIGSVVSSNGQTRCLRLLTARLIEYSSVEIACRLRAAFHGWLEVTPYWWG